MHDDRWRVSSAAMRGWAAACVGALRAAGQRGDAAHAHARRSVARARRASTKQLASRESKPKCMLKPRAAREGAGSEPGEILARTATLRTPMLVPMQSVHEERVASSACPAAQHRMRPTFFDNQKRIMVCYFQRT